MQLFFIQFIVAMAFKLKQGPKTHILGLSNVPVLPVPVRTKKKKVDSNSISAVPVVLFIYLVPTAFKHSLSCLFERSLSVKGF